MSCHGMWVIGVGGRTGGARVDLKHTVQSGVTDVTWDSSVGDGVDGSVHVQTKEQW